MFQQHFKPVVDKLEVNSGELITEQAGYIPPKKQIEDMILAGQRLAESRSQYDWDDGVEIDEDASDPTRSPGFDLADATQMALSVDGRLKASQAAQDARREAQKQQAILDAVERKKRESVDPKDSGDKSPV